MNWDDLKLFLAVSRQPRLEQAAANLKIDPTTLSRHLRRLEISLGQTLFERTRRGHILTAQGEDLVEHAEAMESASLALLRAGEKDQAITGKIRLGVTEGFGTGVIAPSIRDFCDQWPSVELDLITLSGFVSVSKREADMSILLARPQTGRVRVRKLTDYRLQLYASRQYLERAQTIQSIADLAAHRLIGYVDDLIYAPQLRYFGDTLPGLSPHICSPSILGQLEMTRSGLGLCILPNFLARRHDELVKVLSDDVAVERTFWLATHEDVKDFARIRLMTEYLVSLVKTRAETFR
ncbi:LysR family transcriptional regulator [Ponticaulis profundi]|uniref:LysR family transcriptional regulator n=1 Tax=Ponticaulis profundi TaxID=2665222 RepID=A0ABW1SET6_9PROT